jgi:hypothetical protein
MSTAFDCRVKEMGTNFGGNQNIQLFWYVIFENTIHR